MTYEEKKELEDGINICKPEEWEANLWNDVYTDSSGNVLKLK